MTCSSVQCVAQPERRRRLLLPRERQRAIAPPRRNVAPAASSRRRRRRRTGRPPRRPRRRRGISRRSTRRRTPPGRSTRRHSRVEARRSRTSAPPARRPRARPSGRRRAGARPWRARSARAGAASRAAAAPRCRPRASTAVEMRRQRDRCLAVAGRAVDGERAIGRARGDPGDQVRRVAGAVAAVVGGLPREVVLEFAGGVVMRSDGARDRCPRRQLIESTTNARHAPAGGCPRWMESKSSTSPTRSSSRWRRCSCCPASGCSSAC